MKTEILIQNQPITLVTVMRAESAKLNVLNMNKPKYKPKVKSFQSRFTVIQDR